MATKNFTPYEKARRDNINEIAILGMKEALNSIDTINTNRTPKRLRTCSAIVIETDTHYILRSYYTDVAAIKKSTETGFDVLRKVYGYTATSAQHIAKFMHDYAAKVVYTYR